MKHLEKLAAEYAQKNFPIYEGCNDGNNAIKHDVAYHSFADGFNEAMRILMDIGNIKSLDKRIDPFNFIEVEEIAMTREDEHEAAEVMLTYANGDDVEKESELYAQGVVGELSQDVRHLLETAYIAGAKRIMK